MSSVVRPVGPQPPRVYWIRRVLVVVLAAAVVAGLVGLGTVLVGFLGGLGGDGSAAAPEPSETETSAAGSPASCGADDLMLALAADGQTYPEGALPQFTVSVVNDGTASCTFDASSANREVVVTSGADRIWSSADCQPDPEQDLLLLGVGTTAPATVTWNRERSAEGCPSGLPAPRPGTYKATATVAGVAVEPVVFTLG